MDFSDGMFRTRTATNCAPVPRNYGPASHTALRRGIDYSRQGMDAKAVSERATAYRQHIVASAAAGPKQQSNRSAAKHVVWSK